MRIQEYEKSFEYTRNVVNTIKDSLIELLLTLKEIDEYELQTRRHNIMGKDLQDVISGNITMEELGLMLEEKIKIGMIASGQMASEIDSGVSEDEHEQESEKIKGTELVIPYAASTVATPEDRERPPPFPPVYTNLIAGRATTQISSVSPGQGVTTGKMIKRTE